MKKRIISFLMALVMVVSLLPVSAFAVVDASSLTFTDESAKTHAAALNETIKKGLFVVEAPLNSALIENWVYTCDLGYDVGGGYSTGN